MGTPRARSRLDVSPFHWLEIVWKVASRRGAPLVHTWCCRVSSSQVQEVEQSKELTPTRIPTAPFRSDPLDMAFVPDQSARTTLLLPNSAIGGFGRRLNLVCSLKPRFPLGTDQSAYFLFRAFIQSHDSLPPLRLTFPAPIPLMPDLSYPASTRAPHLLPRRNAKRAI
ncbi:hypothetical protein FRC12_006167 [Ceratobasidium sp. 428]|nr:hypothetical protein FRC12_006167 [Ceratobasidium sp. 428]